MNILVVGAGSIGTRHVKNMLALGYKDINIAVCDPDLKKLKLIAEYGNFTIYQNLKTALKIGQSSNLDKNKPDVVFVCNPTHAHVLTARAALDIGAHVFIEKPLSHNMVGIDALIKKAEKKKKTVMIACNYRFNKGFEELEKIVRTETFGKPLTALAVIGSDVLKSRVGNYKNTYAASKKQGGGVILDSCSHAVEYISWLFGKVVAVKASAKNIRKIAGVDVEDYVSMFLQHDSGVMTTIISDYFSRPKKNFLEIQFQNGRAKWDFTQNTVESIDVASDKSVVKKIYKDTEKEHARNDMYIDELRYFFRTIKDGKRPVQDLRRARSIMRVLISAKKNS